MNLTTRIEVQIPPHVMSRIEDICPEDMFAITFDQSVIVESRALIDPAFDDMWY
jgi:hypothetical protein